MVPLEVHAQVGVEVIGLHGLPALSAPLHDRHFRGGRRDAAGGEGGRGQAAAPHRPLGGHDADLEVLRVREGRFDDGDAKLQLVIVDEEPELLGGVQVVQAALMMVSIPLAGFVSLIATGLLFMCFKINRTTLPQDCFFTACNNNT